MSNKGMHLGGIRTLDDMRARCEDVGECWEWQGGYQNHGRCPSVAIMGIRMNGRRAAWILANGPVPEGYLVLSTCCNRRCINPAHMQLLTKAKLMGTIAKKANTVARRTKISATKRAQSHITPDMVQAALTMDAPARQTAAALGMSAASVSAIRRGHRRTGNVWSGLMGVGV